MSHRALSTHQFKVTWAKNKDTLKEGKLNEGTSYFSIQHESHDAAKLMAEQWVAARGHEPTGLEWIP
jgi:hypothetical protein